MRYSADEAWWLWRLPIHFLVAKRFPKAQMMRVREVRGSIYDQFTVLEVDAYITTASDQPPVLLGTVFVQVERKEEIVNDDLVHVTHSYRTVVTSATSFPG